LRILQVTLIGTRTKYQTLGVGGRLLETVKNPTVAGEYDVLITYADHSAVPFFKRHGFTDDVILASRFRTLTDKWDQSILMCYYPHPSVPHNPTPLQQQDYVDLTSLDSRIETWRSRRLEEYSAELGLIEQMRSELKFLRGKVSRYEKQISYLTSELSRERTERDLLEKNLAINSGMKHSEGHQYTQSLPRLVKLELAHLFSKATVSVPPHLPDSNQVSLRQQEREGSDPASVFVNVDPGNVEYRSVANEVSNAVKEGHGISALRVTGIMKHSVADSHKLLLRFSQRLRTMKDSSIHLRLFYGAPAETLYRVLQNGFDLSQPACSSLESFGHGLYFSKFASKAHHYNDGSGMLLIALVALGETETVVSCDPARISPSPNYDSIYTPGRRMPYESAEKARTPFNEEYVVFESSQALPIYIVSYEVLGS